jgi:import inner membrane translocase subunit TIM8
VTSGTFRSGALDKGEQSCLANCVDRFMDANLATMKHLASMRQQQ